MSLYILSTTEYIHDTYNIFIYCYIITQFVSYDTYDLNLKLHYTSLPIRSPVKNAKITHRPFFISGYAARTKIWNIKLYYWIHNKSDLITF